MSETSGELADRLRLRHRLDQFFATLDGVRADTHDRELLILVTEHLQAESDAAVCTVDNDEETRLLIREQHVRASQETAKIPDFISPEQEDGVANAICELAEAYDVDPCDFLSLPTTYVEQERDKIDTSAVFVALNSPEGIVARSLSDIQRLRRQHPQRDAGAFATEERIYQLYAGQPQQSLIGATALSGEALINGLMPVMDYTNAGIHIAATRLIEPGSQAVAFRPGLIIGSNGIIY